MKDRTAYKKQYKEKFPERIKESNRKYRLSHKDSISKSKSLWYLKNKDRLSARAKDRYKANKLEILSKSRKYREANRLSVNKWKRDYYKSELGRSVKNEYTRKRNKSMYNSDTEYTLKVKLRSRIRIAIRKGWKTGSAVRELGCSIQEFKTYIENMFQDGMTWNNWGKWGWHLDHIRPLSSFDLTNENEFREAVNYKNLQPLWAKDNLIKSNKIA